jgi:hypothetical protein
MLDISHIDQEQLSIKLAPINLCMLMKSIVVNFQSTLEQHTLLLSKCPVLTPIIVITGSSALHRACTSMTRDAASPFARALRMKSCCSTSSMLVRVSRIIWVFGRGNYARLHRLLWSGLVCQHASHAPGKQVIGEHSSGRIR